MLEGLERGAWPDVPCRSGNFATLVGWEIPAEYTDVLSNIAVIGVCLLASCKYIKEAATKFTEILNEPKNVEDL